MMKTAVYLPARLKLRQALKKSTALMFMHVLLQFQLCVPLCLLLQPEVIIKLH
jgi:hypothetical protein